MSNDIKPIISGEPKNHNGIFRAKNLGTVSSLNEYIAFRQEHGIADGTYNDIYLGDYFKIQDGTYNVEWMVAHLDYYFHKGDTNDGGNHGIVLIPIRICGSTSKMFSSAITTGGYNASIVHNTVCPAIASALSTVLGSYLLSNRILISTEVNTSIQSMCGANYTGASTGWVWISSQCEIPNEVQVAGSAAYSSSYYDIASDYSKLALYNFINLQQYSRASCWTRSVCEKSSFVGYGANGSFSKYTSNDDIHIRPLIYIN